MLHILFSLLALLLASPALGLSSWYTIPGGTPAGSTAGDKIRGVNLGGWLVTENWMMPDFFGVSPLDQYTVNDEWTYCSILGKEECHNRLQQHWDTYLTEDDFKRFADRGLNTVRIPIGYWAWIDLEDYEPYVQGQLPYLDKALNWSNSYGMDVLVDLHGLPGGQNGQDNQGYKGPIEFQNNATNMDRALDALAKMTQYVTDGKWGGVVKAIQLTNEPYITEYNAAGMSFDTLADFYIRGYQTVRYNEHILLNANEVMIIIHDAFQPILNWQYFFAEPTLAQNWTNYALDAHVYDAFGTSSSKTWQEHLDTICALAANIKTAQQSFPVIIGEFALGVKTYCVDYRSCFNTSLSDQIYDYTSDYNASLFLRQFWEVQSDVYELGAGWIFWSFAGQYAGPWSWTQSSLQNWIPEDPNEKVYPFYSDNAAYCLDTANPIQGDQNMPSFPTYAAGIEAIDISNVVPKKQLNAIGGDSNSTAASNTTTTASTTSASGTTKATASATKSASAGERRAILGGGGGGPAGLAGWMAVAAGVGAAMSLRYRI